MSALTNAAEEYLVAYVMSGTTDAVTSMPSTSSNWWVRLHTADPTETSTAALVDTGVWSNYAHIAIGRSTSAWSTAASEGGGGMRVANSTTIDFGTATLTSDYVITHVSIASSSGATATGWFYGALSTSYTIQNGNPVSIATTALGISFR